jgi:hypothetical protein
MAWSESQTHWLWAVIIGCNCKVDFNNSSHQIENPLLKCPDRFWSPFNLQYNRYRNSFPEFKAAGAWSYISIPPYVFMSWCVINQAQEDLYFLPFSLIIILTRVSTEVCAPSGRALTIIMLLFGNFVLSVVYVLYFVPLKQPITISLTSVPLFIIQHVVPLLCNDCGKEHTFLGSGS